MAELEKLVAIMSPWDNLPALVKKDFRVETLPAEKKVMVWRDDLQSAEKLTAALAKLGVTAVELRKARVTNWAQRP
jgi:hypothetical protein